MAISPKVVYNGQVDASDPAYPQGKARNIVVVGDGIGTPWEQRLVNDIFGFQQALLLAAGITPSGTPDTALVSQYLDAVRWIAAGVRSTYNVKDKKYGAIGNGVTVDTAAIQAAITDAAAAGGEVFFPPGTYLTGQLTVPAGVSLRGLPDVSFILWNHATANQLVFTEYHEGNPVTIQDLRFIASVAATGKSIVAAVAARARFIRCTWNGFNAAGSPSNNLAGIILDASDSDSSIEFTDCAIGIVGNLDAIKSSGRLSITGGKIALPPTYGSRAVLASSGSKVKLTDVELDGSSHVSGTGIFVHASASSFVQLLGSRVTGGSAMLTWDAGARVIESDTIRTDASTGFLYGSTAQLSKGSRLGGFQTVPYLDFGGSAAATVGFGLPTVFLRFTGAVPAITLPAAVWLGQRQRLLVKNDSGSGWAAPSVGPTSVIAFGQAVPSLPAFTGPLLLDYEVVDNGATFPTPNLVWALVYASA